MSRIEIETVETKNINRQHINSSMRNRTQDEIRNWIESGFRKKIGIKFCIICGNELDDNTTTEIKECECGNDKFIEGYLASLVGGYIEMSKNGELKKYYQRIMKTKGSKVRMNEKRTIVNLLIHKDHANIQESVIYKIYNTQRCVESW
jgi:hypothetical protein